MTNFKLISIPFVCNDEKKNVDSASEIRFRQRMTKDKSQNLNISRFIKFIESVKTKTQICTNSLQLTSFFLCLSCH